MKTLPLEFTKNATTYPMVFTQIVRKGKFCIYKQTLPNNTERFVVFKILEKKEALMPNGKTIPAKESIPSSSHWGTYGWTFNTLEKAEEKFKEVS